MGLNVDTSEGALLFLSSAPGPSHRLIESNPRMINPLGQFPGKVEGRKHAENLPVIFII